MARAALIDTDGNVTNVAEVPEGGLPDTWRPGITVRVLDPAEQQVGPGWQLDGDTWTPPAPTPPEPEPEGTRRQRAAELAARLAITPRLQADQLTQAEVAELVPLYPAWEVGLDVQVGEVYAWDHTLVEVVQAHTTQADWTPDLAPALWKLYRDAEAGPQPWVAPTGAHDAYDLGAQVTHGGATWQNDVADNVWEPGVYGWGEVVA